MTRKQKIYILLFAVFFILFLYLKSREKPPINWFPSYVSNHKIPYGTYVLYEQLSTIFPNTTIKKITLPPYVYLKDTTKQGTYIFIDEAVNFGKEEFDELLQFVKKGNTVFISTKGINIDTLNFKTKPLIAPKYSTKPFFKQTNKVFKGKEYTFDRDFANVVFKKIDTINTTTLGISGYINKENERINQGVNFVKYTYGNGVFYFHTFPEVFTNYNLLQENNHQHAANILSYLNSEKPILWDSYYKTGKAKITSPMHYLLNTKPLKWAYYTALIGVLIFIFFEGKRKQRYIKIITPLKNQTLAFSRTIANMYFEKYAHKAIAEHKINYFLEFVRNKLHLHTEERNEVFYNQVAMRSGNKLKDTKKLFELCNNISLKNNISAEELMQLNTLIEKFKNTTHGRK